MNNQKYSTLYILTYFIPFHLATMNKLIWKNNNNNNNNNNYNNNNKNNLLMQIKIRIVLV
jgi:hypothetical protein